MPRIPELESTVKPIAGNQGQFNLHMPDQSFAGVNALAKSLEGVADSFRKAGEEQARQDAESEVVGAMGVARNAMLTADKEMDNTLGEAAFKPDDNGTTFRDKTINGFKMTVNSVMDGLTDDRSKVVFNKWAQEQEYALTTKLNDHETKQKLATYDARDLATIQSGRDLIAFNPNDATTVQKTIDDNKAVIASQGARKGWTDAQFKEALFTEESADRRTVVDRMVRTSPMLAKEYFATHENKFTKSDREHILSYLEPATAEAKGIQEAEAISGRLYNEDYTKLRQELFTKFGGGTSNFDSKGFKIAEAQLAANDHAIKIEKQQNVEKYTTPVTNEIIKIESTGRVVSPKELASMPAYQDMLSSGKAEVIASAGKKMDEVRREWNTEQAQKRAESRAARAEGRANLAEARAARQEAWDKNYYDIMSDPDGLAAMSDFQLKEKYKDVGSTNFKKLEAKKRELTSPENLSRARIDQKVFDGLMSQMDITSATEKQRIRAQVDTYIVALQQEGKTVYNPKRVKEAIIAGMQEVDSYYKEPGLIYGTNEGTQKKRRMDVKNKLSIVIPKDDLVAVDNLLSQYKLPITQENRLQVYDELLVGKGTKKLKGTKK